jgi:hypothetical protein
MNIVHPTCIALSTAHHPPSISAASARRPCPSAAAPCAAPQLSGTWTRQAGGGLRLGSTCKAQARAPSPATAPAPAHLHKCKPGAPDERQCERLELAENPITVPCEDELDSRRGYLKVTGMDAGAGSPTL